MAVTDQLVANDEKYAAAFDKGGLPLPPAARGRSGSGLNPVTIA